MPTPTQRHTRARKKRAASHRALCVPSFPNCPQCKKPKRPHHACQHCMTYKKKKV